MKQHFRELWRMVRQLATDDAYERYLVHHRQMHGNAPALDRRTFYLHEQQRKWSDVKRCC